MPGKAFSVFIGAHALDKDKEMLNPNRRTDGNIPPHETLISCTSDVELNSAGNCSFVVPPGHPYYSEIKPMETEVVIAEIDNVVWFGRVTDTKTDWQNRLTVNCEGPFAYLNDSVQPYEEYYNLSPQEYLGKLLNNHNTQVPSSRQVKLGTVQESAIKLTGTLNYESTMDLVQSFVNEYGGYIYVIMSSSGYAQLYWIEDRNLEAAQEVEYGINLLDLNKTANYADICTAILPLGADVEVVVPDRDPDTGEQLKDEEGNALERIDELPLNLTMTQIQGLEADENGVVPVRYRMPSSPNLNSLIVAGGYAAAYGNIVRTVTFNGVTDVTALRAKASEWIQKQSLGGLTIDVNAVDLRFLDTSMTFAHAFYLGRRVRVNSSVHNVSETLIITRIQTDILKVSKKVTLGRLPEKTLSDIAGRGSGKVEAGVTLRKVESVERLPKDANKSDTIWFIPA